MRFIRKDLFLRPSYIHDIWSSYDSSLEGENAVLINRELMGATNPKEADAGTIRADFADSIDANAVHGSDSLENANIEIDYFFG